MAKTWDQNTRKLVQVNPQTFVDFVTLGARFVRLRSEKLRALQLEVDALLEVVIGGKKVLIHLEFQTYNDSRMPERLLRYNVLARLEYNIPVRSYVIYLLRNGKVKQPPLSWKVPRFDGREEENLRFSHGSIEIGRLTPSFILQIGKPELLPFLPLTKGGATRKIVEQMFAGLAPVNNRDLELIGFTFAALMFNRKKNKADWHWLQERFKHMHDILRESPIYQLILQEGREEGEKRGEKRGEKKGLIAMRQSITDIVQVRFPELVDLAKQRVATIHNFNTLRSLITKISTAEDSEQAKQVLLAQK